MTPLLPRPLKAPGWMTGCLARAGRRKHTQVTNELHQTPRVSLSSISSQPNPGREGGPLPGWGGGLQTTPSSASSPEPWLSALPVALLHRDLEEEPTARAEGRKQASPPGP